MTKPDMTDQDAYCAVIGSTLLIAVAKWLCREPDAELARELAKRYVPSLSEIKAAARMVNLPPTLAALRIEHCSEDRDPGSGLSDEEFDAIVAAARREAP